MNNLSSLDNNELKFEFHNPISNLLKYLQLYDNDNNNNSITIQKHGQANDGDCLFNCIITALQANLMSNNHNNNRYIEFICNLSATKLRNLCCEIAMNDNENYSAAILGYDNINDYK